ncbi:MULTISPECIES: M4 family metallopeptidase [Bacillus]|uniref:M4 family metallopeptidase n=1 Tax=Bacillus cereus TaxID=1396 RepID=A0AAW4R110_BACCE|nr:M4 family metallopeptidase [Bacillus cereus]KAB7652289.1 bacillolysin [Bacillus sp. B2-WWTP-C-10-Post-4]MRC19533.1 bacillolysin [Bacillus thuringiensis]OTX86932.1 bacillolysin [Bacillus thuringiensis serovar londrina]EKS7876689.1 M4 family metallopeptidase [Bacillus cereus]MBY0040704.1 M4 family metallopeptidase [Bacillus cereus]
MLELKEKQERKEILEEDKMFNILYYVNKDELNMISDFKELKEGCIRIATNLYGKNSSEVQAVQQACKAAYI